MAIGLVTSTPCCGDDRCSPRRSSMWVRGLPRTGSTSARHSASTDVIARLVRWDVAVVIVAHAGASTPSVHGRDAATRCRRAAGRRRDVGLPLAAATSASDGLDATPRRSTSGPAVHRDRRRPHQAVRGTFVAERDDGLLARLRAARDGAAIGDPRDRRRVTTTTSWPRIADLLPADDRWRHRHGSARARAGRTCCRRVGGRRTTTVPVLGGRARRCGTLAEHLAWLDLDVDNRDREVRLSAVLRLTGAGRSARSVGARYG